MFYRFLSLKGTCILLDDNSGFWKLFLYIILSIFLIEELFDGIYCRQLVLLYFLNVCSKSWKLSKNIFILIFLYKVIVTIYQLVGYVWVVITHEAWILTLIWHGVETQYCESKKVGYWQVGTKIYSCIML